MIERKCFRKADWTVPNRGFSQGNIEERTVRYFVMELFLAPSYIVQLIDFLEMCDIL